MAYETKMKPRKRREAVFPNPYQPTENIMTNKAADERTATDTHTAADYCATMHRSM
jgi:hypothetical protein